MKYIKIYLFIAFSVLVCSSVLAQKTGFYWYDINESSNRLQGKLKGEIYTLNPLGNESFFLQKDWKDATITLIDGDVFENVKLRYLAYGDEIIAYNNNVRTLFKLEKETVKQFSYKLEETGPEIKFINFCSEEMFKGCRFFQELYSGNSKLLAFHYVEEVKVSPYSDKHGILRDSEFRMNVSYYLHNETKGWLKIQKKRRSFVKNFPDNKKEIKKLLRRNKLLIIDQNSLVQAFVLLDEAGFLN